MEHAAEHVYTPSELNRELKLHLEAGFPRLVVEGEISNLSRPASGHLYFSLKDERAQLRCAMFRSAALRAKLRPANGMLVQARGRISLYEPRGEYQFIVDGLQEAGEGLLQRRFEELKKKLEAEGLFDPARKRPVPRYPARIALVTSPSGAAVRDLVHVLGRRWPAAAARVPSAVTWTGHRTRARSAAGWCIARRAGATRRSGSSPARRCSRPPPPTSSARTCAPRPAPTPIAATAPKRRVRRPRRGGDFSHQPE